MLFARRISLHPLRGAKGAFCGQREHLAPQTGPTVALVGGQEYLLGRRKVDKGDSREHTKSYFTSFFSGCYGGGAASGCRGAIKTSSGGIGTLLGSQRAGKRPDGNRSGRGEDGLPMRGV